MSTRDKCIFAISSIFIIAAVILAIFVPDYSARESAEYWNDTVEDETEFEAKPIELKGDNVVTIDYKTGDSPEYSNATVSRMKYKALESESTNVKSYGLEDYYPKCVSTVIEQLDKKYKLESIINKVYEDTRDGCEGFVELTFTDSEVWVVYFNATEAYAILK